MNTLKVNTPEELHQAISKFLQSDYSHENLVKMYDDTRKCATSFRGIYSVLPVLSSRKSDPLDGLQYIMDWSKEASEVVDDIASNLEQQTISDVTSQLKKLRGFADSVLSLVDTKLKEQAQKEARAKVEKEYKNINEEASKTKGMLLTQRAEVVMKLELEAHSILRRETKDSVQIYLSKDPTFKNRISQHANEINKVLERLNKLVGSDTPTGKLLDIYCKLKSIPLQSQFDDVGYAYSPIDDWADIICGGCNRLYTSIDNVIKTFEEIQTKDLAKKPTETKQGEKLDVLLDSNILNLVRRRIKVKFAERRKALSEEVERIMSKLGFEGSARSSGAFKLVRAACDSEIGIKANIVWDSIQDVLDAVGLSITKTSASALKQEVDHHVEAIVEEISKYMIQRLPMSKSYAYYFDFENIKREVKEKFDVEVDLYVNSLTEKPAEKDRESKNGEKAKRSMLKMTVRSSKDNWEAIKSEYDISKMVFGKKINFVSDSFKRKIIFRDVEHAFVLASEGFAKPAVILAGGVIEELLRLYLEYKGIKPQSKKFIDYIKTCDDNKLLKRGVSRLSDSTRDFRNLVHLSNEKTSRYTISKPTAKGAVASIFTIANDFQKVSSS